LVCSLPCYTAENVEAQRGKGVFGKSIAALQLLNRHGYGRRDDLTIDLVYNPLGPTLPPPQAGLESDYKTRLKTDFDIDFNSLLTIANLPINRFEHFLKRTGQLESYRQLLVDHFNPATVAPLMCRHLLSVDWRGYLYDCDFNQMLKLPLGGDKPKQLWRINRAQLEGEKTQTHRAGQRPRDAALRRAVDLLPVAGTSGCAALRCRAARHSVRRRHQLPARRAIRPASNSPGFAPTAHQLSPGVRHRAV